MNDEPLGRLLGIAGRMLGARFQRILDDSRMTHAGWGVLNALAARDGLTLREVAEQSYVTPASVTGVVDTLERDGLVRRDRSETDRRQVHLFLTKEGAARLAAARKQVRAGIEPLFADLSQRDEAVVRRFLARTIERLGGTESPDTGPRVPPWKGRQ